MATPTEQLEAMRRLEENWDGYGAAAPQTSVIDLAQEFTSLLGAMFRKSAAGPCEIHVSPGRAGGVLIEWEQPTMEHEVEINPDGSIGFLHRDRRTGQIETRKFSPGPLQPGLLQELRQLLAA